MRIGVDLSSLKQAKLREEAGRFLLGGAITVLSGLISRRYGPVIGGLFLAFPAIFPAGATLIEKHETERKRRVGCDGRRRGREAAALDALGLRWEVWDWQRLRWSCGGGCRSMERVCLW